MELTTYFGHANALGVIEKAKVSLEGDDVRDLLRLDQPLDRGPGEHHLPDHLVLRQGVHPGLVGDLLLDQWGADGWELVSVLQGPTGEQHVAYLKRPR